MAAVTSDWRDDNLKAAAIAAAALADAQAARDMAASSRIDLGIVTLTFGGPGLTVTAGDKVVRATVAGALVGDRVYVHEQIGVPDSVKVNGSACVEAAGSVRFKLTVPVLALGVTLSIPLYLVAFRPL